MVTSRQFSHDPKVVVKKVTSINPLSSYTFFYSVLVFIWKSFFSSISVQDWSSLSTGYFLFFHFHLVRAWRLIFLLLLCAAFGKLIHTVQDTTN